MILLLYFIELTLYNTNILNLRLGARTKSLQAKKAADPNAAEDAAMEAAIYAELEETMKNLSEKPNIVEELPIGKISHTKKI
jgi:hypothetical protein